MDIPNILSRRSMLKASSVLIASAAVAPATAFAAAQIPETLSGLLSEYRASADASRAAKKQFEDVKAALVLALDRAQLYAPFCDGRYLQLGMHMQASHPENVAYLLELEQKKALDLAGDDRNIRAAIGRRFASLRRKLARQKLRYEAVEAPFDFDAVCIADGEASTRFDHARQGLEAYRPSSLAEVGAIVRVVGDVGLWVGWRNGLSIRDLAKMLDVAGA